MATNENGPVNNGDPLWWKPKTKLEKRVILLALCLLFVILVLFIALIVVFALHKNNGQTELCDNVDCIQVAEIMLTSIDPKVDPCDNFYEFACGNYVRNVSIPDDNTYISHINKITDRVTEQLKNIIDQPIRANDIKPFALVKTLYKACINKTKIEERGLKPMEDILAKIGGWPLVGSIAWNDTFDWKTAIYRLRRIGYESNYFFSIIIGYDARNTTKQMITLEDPTLGIFEEFLIKGFDDRLVQLYYQFMVDVAVIFGANRQTAMKEAQEMLQFEIKLAKMFLPKELRRTASEMFNPISIKEFQKKYPSIPWVEFINNYLRPPKEVDENEIIDVSIPTYFQTSLKLINQTPKRTLANYISWRTVLSSIQYLTNDLRMLDHNFNKFFDGRTEMVSRSIECIDEVSFVLKTAVGALYIRNYFNEEAKIVVQDMVDNIKAEFREMLINADWMDQTTKEFAFKKLDAIVVHVLYPNELLDDVKLIQLYENLEFNENFYFESSLNETLFSMNYTVSQLYKPVNKTNWVEHSHVTDINAYYKEQENSISLYAGIFQGIFFSANRPKYLNYGGIGFIIAHEVTHGFDDQGSQSDGEGNTIDWWKPVTKQAFVNKTKCIIDQYNNFRSEQAQMSINGINTQSENIADNGGAKEVYWAYRKWAERHGPEPRLPGLSYTPEQLFWLINANAWCVKYRTEYLKTIIITDEHSPNDFRINGALMNSEEFAKDFNCPLGSKMNPRQKCKIW